MLRRVSVHLKIDNLKSSCLWPGTLTHVRMYTDSYSLSHPVRRTLFEGAFGMFRLIGGDWNIQVLLEQVCRLPAGCASTLCKHTNCFRILESLTCIWFFIYFFFSFTDAFRWLWLLKKKNSLFFFFFFIYLYLNLWMSDCSEMFFFFFGSLMSWCNGFDVHQHTKLPCFPVVWGHSPAFFSLFFLSFFLSFISISIYGCCPTILWFKYF